MKHVPFMILSVLPVAGISPRPDVAGVICRARNEGLRRFHNHGEGLYLNLKALVGAFNQEKALEGAFFLI